MAGRYFIPLRKFLNGIINLDLDEIVLEITKTSEFKTLVIKLNTEGLPTSQLFIKGKDALGRSLDSLGGPYSPFTVSEKRRKGQPTNRVTLKDTGDFYLTFEVIPLRGGFIIEADTIKDGDNLEDRYGNEIVGLDAQNVGIILEFYKRALDNRLKRVLNVA